MAQIEQTEFVFPDEIEEKESKAGGRIIQAEPEDNEEPPEIEIVDDTPEEDQNRTPMETPPEDPTDEELATYSKRDRNRIKEFTKGYHEERRQKESALREREHALQIAQAIMEENKRLKGTVNLNQTALLDQAKRVVSQEMEEAKRKYKTAYESGDADALVEAQEEMTTAKLKSERVNNFKPQPIDETPVVPQQQTYEDPKAVEWKTNNKWFGSDKEMTGFALALHDKLVNEERLNPQSDEYYRRINGRLRQVFPEKFDSGEPADAKSQRPKSNVVASASRSTAPKKIVLSKSEVAIAKRLGLSLESYAREVAVLRRKENG